MITNNENEGIEGVDFSPFNDTDGPRIEEAINSFENATDGIDTTLIDPFRQGVELRTPKQVYNTTQPKIWAGNLKHHVRTTTYGQARDFTQYDGTQNFQEKPIFDPVWYIIDPDYPHPIIFNDGPMQEEEAIIEPFTIPFRINNAAEGPFYARSVKGSLEDGNNLDSLDGGTTRIEQFIEYNAPITPRFFLDEGQAYIGTTLPTGSFLTTRFNPIALYDFNNNILDKSGNGHNLFLAPASGTIAYENGPFGSVSSFAFNGTTGLTSSTAAALILTNSYTIQAVVRPKPQRAEQAKALMTIGEINSSVSNKQNIFANMSINTNVFDNGPTFFESIGCFFWDNVTQSGFGGASNGAMYRNDEWMHIAVATDDLRNSFFYINGSLVFSCSHIAYPVIGNITDVYLTVGGIPVNTTGFTILDTAFSGSMSSLKVVGSRLTDAEILEEAELALPYQSGLWNKLIQQSTIIYGFQPLIRRDMDPFDDTADEEIVAHVSSSNADFVAALKELDFDLSEDIRGSFNKKSATAGGDVYGPGTTIAGTDSIIYRNMIRGC
jgi:hypothetical protein